MSNYKEVRNLGSAYTISKDQYDLAKNLGVKIKPSKKKYKIDIYDGEGIYYTSVGDNKYNDYFTYLREKGKDYAEERRRLYDIRTKKNVGSRNWFARRLLWGL